MHLIPRSVLFGNPIKFNPQISPDGKYISYLAPMNGVSNIWITRVGSPSSAVCISDERKRGIADYAWTYLEGVLVYAQDQSGDENFGIYRISVQDSSVAHLAGGGSVRAEIVKLHYKSPNQMIIAMNDRDQRHMDYYRIDLEKCELQLVFRNEKGFIGLIFDSHLIPRYGNLMQADGNIEVQSFDLSTGEPELLTKISLEDEKATGLRGFADEDRYLVFADSRERDKAALKVRDLITGNDSLVAEHPKCDLFDFYQHPATEQLEAAVFYHEQLEFVFLSDSFRTHIKFLRAQQGGDLDICARALDDSKWLVSFSPDNSSATCFLYDTRTMNLTLLFEERPQFSKFRLHEMKSTTIHSRDGLELVCYLTTPRDPVAGSGNPNPTVVLVHGGPWWRVFWGFDANTQWLADRGYSVISVNFRGSTGFGKAFVNAANREWGAKMHDDIIDACRWAVESGHADPNKLAIFGSSYGGYAALVGVTFTPEFFACAVDFCGPSDLVTLLSSFPSYWAPRIAMFKARVGDFETSEGREFLATRSPINFVDKISKPLLVLQGANDPRVRQSESDRIYEAMKNRDVPVEYVIFSDEGHVFQSPQNNIAAAAIVESFLGQHLGGQVQPEGDDVRNSSAKILK